MKTQFSLNLHILDPLPFHGEILSIYADNCICQISGEPVFNHPEILSNRDSSDMRSPLGKTNSLEPHFDWLRSTIGSNRLLFDRVAAANGIFEISVLAAVIGGRGFQINLPVQDITLFGNMQMGIRITFVNL